MRTCDLGDQKEQGGRYEAETLMLFELQNKNDKGILTLQISRQKSLATVNIGVMSECVYKYAKFVAIRSKIIVARIFDKLRLRFVQQWGSQKGSPR
jgi:hypothetical protein